jgi:hypothetical protein
MSYSVIVKSYTVSDNENFIAKVNLFEGVSQDISGRSFQAYVKNLSDDSVVACEVVVSSETEGIIYVIVPILAAGEYQVDALTLKAEGLNKPYCFLRIFLTSKAGAGQWV